MDPVTHVARKNRRQRVVAAIQSGLPLETAAETYSLSSSYIYRLCREKGVACTHVRRNRPTWAVLKILAELLKGCQGRVIAGKMGISLQRVEQVREAARDAGIPVPARRKGVAP